MSLKLKKRKNSLLDHKNLLVPFIVNFKTILRSSVTVSFKICDFCYDPLCDLRRSFIHKSKVMGVSRLVRFFLVYSTDSLIAVY